MSEENKTHFGYQKVDRGAKAGLVANVFHSVASRYDLMNDLMSAGIHRVWKRFTIEVSAVRPGDRVLDIAGGTGDLTARFSRLVGPGGEVVLADINDSMLKVGRDKLIDGGFHGNIEYVQANAERLPFPDNHFNIVSIAFGLRNVTDKESALQSMLRVLKPGGRLLILEPAGPVPVDGYQRLPRVHCLRGCHVQKRSRPRGEALQSRGGPANRGRPAYAAFAWFVQLAVTTGKIRGFWGFVILSGVYCGFGAG